MVAIAGGVVLFGLLFAALFRGVLVLFAGILLGVFLCKLSQHLARLINVRYGAAFAIVVALLVVLILGTGSFMGARISYQINEFTQQFQQASEQFRDRIDQLGWSDWFPEKGSGGPGGLSPQRLISTAGSAALVTISVIAGVVLVLFLGFYFALQPDVYREGVLALVPERSQARAEEVLERLTRTLWWWMLGRLVGMSVIAVVSIFGLRLLEIPLPITLGVIAGLMNFIPNLGPLLASVPPILFGLQQGTHVALYVAAFYLLLQFVESYFITPLIDQRQVHLPPGLTLSAQLLFGLLAGVFGLLLATPLTAVVYVLVGELYVKDVLKKEE